MENALSTSNGSLKDLVNSEYYLEKFLGHLVDYGLYECRLVCRKWYDVCSRLPVKLKDVPVTKLPVLVDRFPNAVALSLHDSIEWNHETEEVIPSLARLTGLESIELHGVSGDHEDEFVSFYNLLGEALQSWHDLHSISIRWLWNDKAGLCLYSRLSHLTGLTRLHFPDGWEQPVSDPYTDVRNIEDLAIESVCLESGQLVFPSLTHLTRLEMHLDAEPAKNFRGGALQMILPYAASLQSLIVHGGPTVETEWALLGEFVKISSVEFIDSRFDVDRDFCAALDCLSLTHLGFDECKFSEHFSKRMAEVKSLTSLKSLWFRSVNDNVCKVFAATPQLTSLHMLSDLNSIESLTVLTALRDLEFSQTRGTQSNLSHVFSFMPHLETLDITCTDGRFSSTWFSLLKNLRSFSLGGYSLDGDAFPMLAQLSELTRLVLNRCYLYSQSGQWSGINALTNLERLNLWNDEQTDDQLNAVLEGKLSKLKYLSLYTPDEDELNHWRTLHQRLPSLRKCIIREPDEGLIVYPEGFELFER